MKTKWHLSLKVALLSVMILTLFFVGFVNTVSSGEAKIINKTNTSANWISTNPVLNDGEIGYASDTHLLKIGNGSTAWNDLEGIRVPDGAPLGSIVGIPKALCYPTSQTFLAAHHLDGIFDATWGKGSLVGIPINDPVVFGGFLDLSKPSPVPGQYVDYDGVLNAGTAIQKGCVRFDYVPMYEPGSIYFNSKLFALMDSEGSLKNLIELLGEEHSNEFEFCVTMYDKDGVEICHAFFGDTWLNYSMGMPYTFELNWDLNEGAVRMFINGAQFGNTVVATGIRDGNIHKVRVGNGYDPTNYWSLFKIDNFKIFNDVIHTENYTISDYDEELLALPTGFENYIICTGGGFVNNVNSIYNGFPLSTISTPFSPDVLMIWKILE